MAYNEFIAANTILKDSGLGMLDAARLVLEASEVCGPSIKRIREIIRLGAQELERREHSIPLSLAIERSLEFKKDRRPRTLADIRQLMSRLIRTSPSLGETILRSITSDQCEAALDEAFPTPRQRLKARVILSGIFTIGQKKGWCTLNPVNQLSPDPPTENEIRPLSLPEVTILLETSLQHDHGSCAAAIGLMLYAGIRPQEVERLTWHDVCLNEKVISLKPRHTKTGGARHVTVLPVLDSWLKICMLRVSPVPDSLICPKNWKQKWRRVRQLAGWNKKNSLAWQQDCLRHTYASYHAKHFRDFALLQMEMGHSSLALLRTRYLNMNGVTKSSARAFWEAPPPIRMESLTFAE